MQSISRPHNWFLYGFYLARLRIDRAHHHLTDLKRTVAALNKPNSDLISRYGYPEDDSTDSWSEELGDLNAQEIHLIIGDLVSNLRIALNYSAVAVAAHDSGLSVRDSKVQFPIESTPQSFVGRRRTYLKGISDEHVAFIERVQPYSQCQWTKRLQALSNRDKHFNVIVLQHEVIGQARYHEAEAPTGETYMEMDCDVKIEVTFRNGAPVVKTLQVLETSVADFLSSFNRTLIEEWRAGRRPWLTRDVRRCPNYDTYLSLL